jgi:hypothetical protein
MVFASSKDALRRALVGIAVEIQGTDSSEVAYESGAFSPGCAMTSVIELISLFSLLAVLEKANRGH